MKAITLLLAVPAALALPSSEFQAVLNNVAQYTEDATTGFRGIITEGLDGIVSTVETVLESDEVQRIEKWIDAGKQFVKENGLVYELVTHPVFADYALRTTEPELCDPAVKQYSGYLDTTDGKHLFFWFFESRGNPKKDPLVLWLNGGPGCSSSTGLLFELGPCRIADEGKNTTFNPHSWTEHANVIFLDQPVNVGYSYSSDGSKVNTSPVAGEDVYAFLELFLLAFPQYAELPFHIAAESYGGTYAPNIASVIHRENGALGVAPTPVPGVRRINLESVILANGLTNPMVQMESVPDYACEGPYAVYDDPEGPECQALRSKVPTCKNLIRGCYDFTSRLTCVPAALYCWSQLFGPLQQLGLNMYDVRRKCDREKDGDLCYRELSWIDSWMNDAKNKAALGANPAQTFQSCNMEVNQDFMFQGDGMHNSAALLPELVNDGIRLLVYAGNADMACNYIGNERWVEQLESKFSEEYSKARSTQWTTRASGRVAGEVRSAGPGAGNVTFVQVYEAGHMVPFDQAEAALDMFSRWISGESFAD